MHRDLQTYIDLTRRWRITCQIFVVDIRERAHTGVSSEI